MKLAILGNTLLAYSLLFACSKQTHSHIVIDASSRDLTSGYLAWAHLHPEAFNRANGGSLVIELPTAFVELIAPDGRVVFRGTEDKANATFILSLNGSMPNPPTLPVAKLEPTAQEYLTIFKQPESQKDRLKNAKYILLVRTYLDDVDCAAQNNALGLLRPNAMLTIVEVRLKHGA